MAALVERMRPHADDTSGAQPVFRIKRSLEDEGDAERRAIRRAVARAKDGDPGALHEIYVRYADNVFSYVRAILRDDHAAEDVTQHVFAKLMTKISKYEERSVPFAAWLLRIARNAAIDHVRSDRMVYCEDVSTVDDPAYDDVEADQRDVISDALRCLPDGQRRVVVLRHVIGLSPREIAAQMGKSEGAIHTLHHRARRALQSELLRRDTAPVVAGVAKAAA